MTLLMEMGSSCLAAISLINMILPVLNQTRHGIFISISRRRYLKIYTSVTRLTRCCQHSVQLPERQTVKADCDCKDILVHMYVLVAVLNPNY